MVEIARFRVGIVAINTHKFSYIFVYVYLAISGDLFAAFWHLCALCYFRSLYFVAVSHFPL